MAATQTVPQQLQDRNSPTSISPRHGVVTLFGYGIQVQVERGHLTLEDGIGFDRRKARLPRVGHGLRRLVVIGNDGMVSLAALRWLADQGAAFVMLNRDGSVLATTGPVRSSDARLRRAQAIAHETGAALRIVRELIRQKLGGQQRIARDTLHSVTAPDAIGKFHDAVDAVGTIPAVRQLEAQGALAYWSAWKNLPVTFIKADARKVPDHWTIFGARISPVSRSPRCAVNPPNAILNYLYAVLEAEARLAVAAVGLDPGLGFLHADSRSRDSLACDLMEPVRPAVDAHVLDWITHRPMRREWFFEQRDGTCRLMGSFAARLAETARAWGHLIGPWAELVARTLWATVEKPGKSPATHLTGDHRREGRSGEHMRPVVLPPKPCRVCTICGVPCEKTYCASCGKAYSQEEFARGRLLAQTPEARALRSATQKAHVLANQTWKPSKEFEWLDKETYLRRIQPRLASVTISALQSNLRISESYAAFIRSGSRIPHPRHWPALARLVGFWC